MIVEAPPLGQEDLNVDWWTKNAITIEKNAQSTAKYPNSYRVQRFELTPDEVGVYFNREEDTGIHFR